MKGLFIPGITAEMFRNGCLESIEALMSEGKIFDIETDWAWVPVSEMLPKKRGFYLITTEKTHDVDICSWNGSRFESYPNGCLVVLRPQAWMPLPEPYKGDE